MLPKDNFTTKPLSGLGMSHTSYCCTKFSIVKCNFNNTAWLALICPMTKGWRLNKTAMCTERLAGHQSPRGG